MKAIFCNLPFFAFFVSQFDNASQFDIIPYNIELANKIQMQILMTSVCTHHKAWPYKVYHIKKSKLLIMQIYWNIDIIKWWKCVV